MSLADYHVETVPSMETAGRDERRERLGNLHFQKKPSILQTPKEGETDEQ